MDPYKEPDCVVKDVQEKHSKWIDVIITLLLMFLTFSEKVSLKLLVDSLTINGVIIIPPITYLCNALYYTYITNYTTSKKHRSRGCTEYKIPSSRENDIVLINSVAYIGILFVIPLISPQYYAILLQFTSCFSGLIFFICKKISFTLSLGARFLLYIICFALIMLSYIWNSRDSVHMDRNYVLIFMLFLFIQSIGVFIIAISFNNYPSIQYEFERNIAWKQFLVCVIFLYLFFSFRNPENIHLYDLVSFLIGFKHGFFNLIRNGNWLLLVSHILCNFIYNYTIKKIYIESYSSCVPIALTLGFICYYTFLTFFEAFFSNFYGSINIINPFTHMAAFFTVILIYWEEYDPITLDVDTNLFTE